MKGKQRRIWGMRMLGERLFAAGLAIFAAVFIGSIAIHAQQSAPAGQAPAIRTTVELVNVPVNATNHRGQRVIDLTRDEVKVYEDDVEQKITNFERETRTPLRIGLILDTSNSARTKLAYEKDAAQQFADLILANAGPSIQVFLETFDSSSSIVQDFTYDPDDISSKLEDVKSGGGKALYDAIVYACKEKMLSAGAPEEMRRVLVVVSDGLDVESQHTLDQTISLARMAEVMIYTVGTAAYGFDNPGDKILEQLAGQTGGYPFFPLRNTPGTDLQSGYIAHGQLGDTSQNKAQGTETGELSSERMVNLVGALQVIGHDLSEQYLISYKPTRNVLDGSYRTIRVETTRRGVTLRWKPGYFATAEQKKG